MLTRFFHKASAHCISGHRYLACLPTADYCDLSLLNKAPSLLPISSRSATHTAKIPNISTAANMGRNHSLAIDLENLPLEMSEEVLKDLNFEQAILLSSRAGPQLESASEISPSWKQHFGTEENHAICQKYLQLTDQINVVCFDTRRDARAWFKLETHYYYYYGNYRREHSSNKNIKFLQDGPSCDMDGSSGLRTQWLEAMGSALQVGAAFFGDAPFQRSSHPKASRDARSKEGDVEKGLRHDQGALSARRSSLVGELRRLATLYEAHPQLLKLPYAPQDSNTDTRHIPRQFRARANKIEKAPLSIYTSGGGRTYFNKIGAALVPFDWTIRFLVSILRDEKEIEEKSRFLLDSLARYYLRKAEPGGQQNIYDAGIPWLLSLLKPRQLGFLAGSDGREWIKDETPLSAHVDNELDWLEKYVEAVAELVKKYPEAAKAARFRKTDSVTVIDQLGKLELV